MRRVRVGLKLLLRVRRCLCAQAAENRRLGDGRGDDADEFLIPASMIGPYGPLVGFAKEGIPYRSVRNDVY